MTVEENTIKFIYSSLSNLRVFDTTFNERKVYLIKEEKFSLAFDHCNGSMCHCKIVNTNAHFFNSDWSKTIDYYLVNMRLVYLQSISLDEYTSCRWFQVSSAANQRSIQSCTQWTLSRVRNFFAAANLFSFANNKFERMFIIYISRIDFNQHSIEFNISIIDVSNKGNFFFLFSCDENSGADVANLDKMLSFIVISLNGHVRTLNIHNSKIHKAPLKLSLIHLISTEWKRKKK